ncbi:hypothetical protein MTR_4g019270 [Medicago truncatula]|uniref:Uncharacterized protein n=1 Tax=Medicago truncatula TaxID=3880 RepID=G7JS90_MEDTR|nr:hypothetical protein MTR_4g019270 [Medicago truncatula]
MDIGMSPWRLAPNSETYSMKDKHNLLNQKFREICEVQSMWRNNNLDRKNANEYIEYGMSNIKDHLNRSFLLEDVDSVRAPDEN